ncbi:MAG: hypothetical protein L3K14_03330 [Thermoplasmata archaeon]|nr:hypothetical protein [Thermoplasmata archaeon]
MGLTFGLAWIAILVEGNVLFEIGCSPLNGHPCQPGWERFLDGSLGYFLVLVSVAAIVGIRRLRRDITSAPLKAN